MKPTTILTITPHHQGHDKKFSFTQCPGTQETAALVADWFVDRFGVRPVGSVTLRRALVLYLQHLRSLNTAPADLNLGHGMGNPYPLQLGELRAIEGASHGYPRSDAPVSMRNSMKATMLRMKLKGLGYQGQQLTNLVYDGIQGKKPIAEYVATIPQPEPRQEQP